MNKKRKFLSSKTVRFQAARALGRLGGPRAVKALIQALENGSSGVQEEAANALGEIGSLGE